MKTIVFKYCNSLNNFNCTGWLHRDRLEPDIGVNKRERSLNKKENINWVGDRSDRNRRYKSPFQEFRGKK